MAPAERLGKYELVEKLGEGGMAQVFRARRPGAAGFEKTVVIKRILPHFAKTKAFVEMFVREAKIAASVNHKNVVQVFELEEVEDTGELFMVMEYVRGTDLRFVLRSASRRKLRLPPWFSIHCMAEILDGLAYAHGLVDDAGQPRNLVHRDVTPSNIFLSHLGDVKLGDFGVARDDTLQAQTRTGQMKGKVAYMAPEQLHILEIDGRADVFAAGVVLWECLTQRRLFAHKSDFETMKMIVDGERPLASKIRKDVPEKLDTILQAALQPERDDRIESAGELRSRLLQVLYEDFAPVHREKVREVLEVFLGDREAARVAEPIKKTGSSATPASFDSHGNTPEASTPEAPPDDEEMALAFEESEAGSPQEPGFPRPRPGMREVTPLPDLPPGVRIMVGKPEKAGTADLPTPDEEALDLERLVGTAAADAAKESTTADVVVPQESLLAGLDIRRHSAQIAEMAKNRWSSYGINQVYEGPHPFWLQDHEGTVVGPVSLDQAQRIFQAEAFARMSGDSKITADQRRWVTLQRYAELTGQTTFTRDDEHFELAPNHLIAQLHSSSMARVFADLSRRRVTGRLYVRCHGYRRFDFRELDVVNGRPVAAYANEESLQLPTLLVSKRLVPKGMLEEIVHKAVQLDRGLSEVASARLATNLDAYASVVEREKLIDMFAWEAGDVFLDSSVEKNGARPFASSLASLVMPMVSKAFHPLDLVQRVKKRHWETAFRPAGMFEREIDALALTEAQRKLADRLAAGKRLSQITKAKGVDDRVAAFVAYTLVETELLVP